MKIFLLTTFVIGSFITFAQESYDFSLAVPPNESVSNTVDPSLYGKYKADSMNARYEFDEQGIWVVSTIYSSISRETIRESSKYEIRNGYIFGVVEGDSLPVVLEDENFFFGVRHREQLIGGSSKNTLKKLGRKEYVINFYENGGYTPSLLTFSGKKVVIQHFDYDTGTNIFSKVSSKQEKLKDGMTYIQLAPTKKEWNELEKNGVFGKELTYKKEG